MSTREQAKISGQNSATADPPPEQQPPPGRDPSRAGRSGHPRGRSLAPLAGVTVAALIFAVLLLLIRLKWAPLESADRSAADHVNSLVAGQPALVSIVKYVTMLGSTLVLAIVIAAAVLLLALRRRWRLAAYLVVAGVGELILDPILKDLVGRLRPVVPHAIQHAPGHSFPSGHSFGSMVCYGALFLVFAPAARGRARTVFGAVIAALIAIRRHQPDPARRALYLGRHRRLGARDHLARPDRGGVRADQAGGRKARPPTRSPTAWNPRPRSDLRPAQPESAQPESAQPESAQPETVQSGPPPATRSAGPAPSRLACWSPGC